MMRGSQGSIRRCLLGLGTCALVTIGCGAEEPVAPTPAKGTIALSFSVSNSLKSNPNLVDPLLGVVYGALFLSEDVSVTGPRADAMEFGSVELADVDLRMSDQSAGTWRSQPLDPGRYVFLGMIDVDGNGSMSRDPDPGDPVTLPTTNQFDIVKDQETTLTVVFDLVYN